MHGCRPSPRRLSTPARVPAPPSGSRHDIDGWLAAHVRWILAALIAASVILRAVYFIQLYSDPCLAAHRWDQTDMHYFERWGQAIAQGDWLSRSVAVPMHAWHHDVAEEYFKLHPEARAGLQEQAARLGGETTAASLLWARWTGGHQFYQDPLYSYLIGLTYAVAGPYPRYVFAWQLMLGVASNVLIFLIGRRYFGELAGVLAAILALLASPLLYYELLLLRDSVIVFAALGIVYLTGRAFRELRPARLLTLGVALGLGVLLKSTFVLMAAGVAAALAWHFRGQWSRLVRPAGAFAAGLAIAWLPLAARNLAVGVSPFALAGSGALTFAASNDVTYPERGGFYVHEARLADVLGRADGETLPAVSTTLAEHSPASLAALVGHKIDNSWHWYEIPNNVNYYYVRLHAPVLAWLPVTFFVLGPLGLVGLALAAPGFRRVWPLYLLVVSTLVGLVGFLVLGRLRVVLLAAVIPFAAHAIACCLRAGSMRVPSGVVAATVLVALWTGRPLPDHRPLIELNDWLFPFFVEYQPQVKAALDANDAAGAAKAYLAFLRYEPDFLAGGRPSRAPQHPAERDVARAFAQIHATCASLLNGTGRAEQAREEMEKASRLRLWADG